MSQNKAVPMEARRPRLSAPAVKTSPALPEPDARSTTLNVSFQRYSFSRGGEKRFSFTRLENFIYIFLLFIISNVARET